MAREGFVAMFEKTKSSKNFAWVKEYKINQKQFRSETDKVTVKRLWVCLSATGCTVTFWG